VDLVYTRLQAAQDELARDVGFCVANCLLTLHNDDFRESAGATLMIQNLASQFPINFQRNIVGSV